MKNIKSKISGIVGAVFITTASIWNPVYGLTIN
jgi:hypothetical protein